MKKWISLIAVLIMVFSLAACAAQKGETPAPAEETQLPAQAEETAAEVPEEDGQNPIMNFIGIYGHDRATILVEATDAQDGVKCTVTWSSSAAEHSEWVMTGKFDAETLTVKYNDCVKTDYVFKEDGTVDSETVVYENGEGTLTFTEDLTLTWDDAVENIADGTVFEYASFG